MDKKHEESLCWIHQGHNVRSVREANGMEIEVLASKLGLSVDDLYGLEARRRIEEELLVKIAAILSVPVEVLKEKEEPIPMYETHTNYKTTFIKNGSVNGTSENGGAHWEHTTFHASPTIHPIDKMAELLERMLTYNENRIQELEKKSGGPEEK